MGELTQKEKTIWFVVFILEGTVIIFCNIISLIVFSKKARTSKPCLLLMNQSLADLLVGLEAVYYSLQFLSLMIYRDDGNSLDEDGCLEIRNIFKMMIWTFVVNLSLGTLALIAVDRAYAVFMPFRHRVLKSKHYYLGILGVWTISLSLLLFYIYVRCKSFRIDGIVTFALAMTAVLGTFLVLIAAYTSIYIKVKFFPVFQNDTNSNARSQIKLSLTLFFASFASMATIIPSTLIMIYAFLRRNNTFTGSLNNLEHSSNLMIFANSFMNFIIYAWRFPEFVNGMKTLFRCKKGAVNNVLSLEMASNVQAKNTVEGEFESRGVINLNVTTD